MTTVELVVEHAASARHAMAIHGRRMFMTRR
jgi:hypothetical protein